MTKIAPSPGISLALPNVDSDPGNLGARIEGINACHSLVSRPHGRGRRSPRGRRGRGDRALVRLVAPALNRVPPLSVPLIKNERSGAFWRINVVATSRCDDTDAWLGPHRGPLIGFV